jgi:hypothetical protein
MSEDQFVPEEAEGGSQPEGNGKDETPCAHPLEALDGHPKDTKRIVCRACGYTSSDGNDLEKILNNFGMHLQSLHDKVLVMAGFGQLAAGAITELKARVEALETRRTPKYRLGEEDDGRGRSASAGGSEREHAELRPGGSDEHEHADPAVSDGSAADSGAEAGEKPE